MAVTMLTSWVDTANDRLTDFPIQNLPLGVFSTGDLNPRIGMAIGDQILDVRGCVEQKLFVSLDTHVQQACRAAALNQLMSLGHGAMSSLRNCVTELLRKDAPTEARKASESSLVPKADATMHLPAAIGDYTDFYASIYHATNVGRLFRPDNPLLPNYKYVPIGYHGRASSIVISGTAIRRPHGQIKLADTEFPSFLPSRLLDYELEVGCFVGRGNKLGEAISIDQAEDHMFGLCLLNDWSARDVQAWEYQPLGPFLAKNFATSISPWVVTMEALKPFRVPAFKREADEPEPLSYLRAEADRMQGGIDLKLEVWITTQRMREAGQAPFQISQSNLRDLYWTLAQMLTHHASNGCNLQPGDLLGTGTVSGAGKKSEGCLLEQTRRGAEPIELPNGEMREFLEDGDEVILRGYCEREGYPRIGFGECRGIILPAV